MKKKSNEKKRSKDFRKAGPGRPAKYETPEKLFEAVATHFEECEEAGIAPTVNSLTLSLGFTQRNALDYYAEKGEEYSNIITRAKLFVMVEWERAGADHKKARFAQFVLEKMKGSGYREKDVELNGKIRLTFGFGGDDEPGPERDKEYNAGVEG